MDPSKLQALLDTHHEWPGPYTFKFVVRQEQAAAVVALFPGETPVLKPSGKGTYVSVTVTATMASSDAVLAIYQQAGAIEGLIAL